MWTVDCPVADADVQALLLSSDIHVIDMDETITDKGKCLSYRPIGTVYLFLLSYCT